MREFLSRHGNRQNGQATQQTSAGCSSHYRTANDEVSATPTSAQRATNHYSEQRTLTQRAANAHTACSDAHSVQRRSRRAATLTAYSNARKAAENMPHVSLSYSGRIPIHARPPLRALDRTVHHRLFRPAALVWSSQTVPGSSSRLFGRQKNHLFSVRFLSVRFTGPNAHQIRAALAGARSLVGFPNATIPGFRALKV